MLNTLTRNTHLTATGWSSPPPAAAASSSSEAAHIDRFVASSSSDSAGLYNPRMFAQRNTSGNSAAGAAATDGYGGRGLSSRNLGNAEGLYREVGDHSHSLDDRADIGRLISHSPQIDSMLTTDGDEHRCGGAAIFNAMLLDGDHAANSDALRATLGDHITPQQRTALDHMRAGRLSPNEAAELQEGIFDHAEDLNGAENHGLNLADMRRTVAELREHGAFPNTRELNFRRESVGAGADDAHWTVSSRTTHGTHFADSWPQANGCARVSGAEEAAFSPTDAPDRVMLDSLDLSLDSADRRHDVAREVFQETRNGPWVQRSYDMHNASIATSRPMTVPYRG